MSGPREGGATPVPPADGAYSIEARSLSVAGIAGHDFWVLRGPDGRAMAELHGLATDRETGRAIPIGTDAEKHSLRIWHYVHDQGFAAEHDTRTTRATYIQDGQPHRSVASGDREEIVARWNSAVAAREPLNALDLDYPPYGFKVFGNTVNSNSAYRTLGEIMNVPVRDFSGRVEPGIDNRMTTPAEIERLRDHGYPAATEPGRDSASLRDGRGDAAGLFAGLRNGEAGFADALRDLQASARGQQFDQAAEAQRAHLATAEAARSVAPQAEASARG